LSNLTVQFWVDVNYRHWFQEYLCWESNSISTRIEGLKNETSAPIFLTSIVVLDFPAICGSTLRRLTKTSVVRVWFVISAGKFFLIENVSSLTWEWRTTRLRSFPVTPAQGKTYLSSTEVSSNICQFHSLKIVLIIFLVVISQP
jgi:hypothetical protein